VDRILLRGERALGLTVGPIELTQIALRTRLQVLETARDLLLRVVAVPAVDRLELAPVNRHLP